MVSILHTYKSLKQNHTLDSSTVKKNTSDIQCNATFCKLFRLYFLTELRWYYARGAMWSAIANVLNIDMIV